MCASSRSATSRCRPTVLTAATTPISLGDYSAVTTAQGRAAHSPGPIINDDGQVILVKSISGWRGSIR